ncbi:MAG TPA: hypothetical protein PK239_06475, partial [Chitinophagales bacterium]|nr:hypothetical protein [Chitinophagales bacterium]
DIGLIIQNANGGAESGVLTKFFFKPQKMHARVSAKFAKTWCFWRKILPISLQIHHDLAGWAVPKWLLFLT